MSSWDGTDQFQANAPAASDTSKARGAQRHHRRQKWGLNTDEILVMLLKEEYGLTGLASSFKCEVWSRIATAFSEKTKECVNGTQLKNRWKYLKKKYRLYASLVNKSGWTWDYAQHRPTQMYHDVWDEIIKLNKEYKTAREHSFPLYWDVHKLAGASTATGRYAFASTEERTIVDIIEGSGSSGSPEEQQVRGNGDSGVGERDEPEVFVIGSKRKKPASDSPHVGKKSADPTVEALEKLVELSDRRSKIVEQYESDENYSYKLSMARLTSLPGITAEEIFVGGQAIKQRDERIFFHSIPDMAVSFLRARARK
ncbi:hypothetical protein J5N97_010466 [Dioscorea zingiberensis]|uniref:Myb/SANT-like domain-containing protein n=1 Tax=Dioscorea zingiberensis TaxID=325984 RepID=A0A9D5CZ62_9LILI|nr:hypothetical protein J5N97_010466 [Dioscorea zingiberensis]